MLLWSSLYIWGNWGLKQLSNLTKVLAWISDRCEPRSVQLKTPKLFCKGWNPIWQTTTSASVLKLWLFYRKSSGYLSRGEGLLGTGGLRKPHRNVFLSHYGLLNKNADSERASNGGGGSRGRPGGQRGQGQGHVSLASTSLPHQSSCLQCL